MSCKPMLILSLCAAMALPAAASGRNVITPAQIAGAVSDFGMRVSADQVTLMSDVVAMTGSPTLVVHSMEPWGDHRMKVRLGCVTSEECLPFFVAVRLSPENAAQPVPAALGRPSTVTLRTRPDPNSFVLRSGSQAVLLLDGEHIHIRLKVVCLENGAPGQTIRVASKDHRQTYTALVVDSTVVRGSL
jgi:hypothetical protein